MKKSSDLKPEMLRQERCAGCGEELLGSSPGRRYCSSCRELGEIKEHWQPFYRGVKIVKAFSIKDRQHD